MAVAYVAPDHVRCGSRLYAITWARLVAIAVLVLTAVLLVTAASESAAARAAAVATPPDATAPRRGVASSSSSSNSGGLRRGNEVSGGAVVVDAPAAGAGAPPPAVMPRFCEAHAATYFLDKWKLARLGATGWPSAAAAEAACSWREATATEVPFRMCTFDPTVDTQVSAFIHKDGFWNDAKRRALERVLPILGSAADPFPDRTMFIDVRTCLLLG